ncbi:MAG: zeta toxin family protein [Promethearchaeota archaeon]
MDFFQDFLLFESINDKSILKAIFMTGHPGSGKSYVLKKIKSGQIEPRIVNIDKFVEKYGYMKDHTKKLIKSQLTNYINSMLPLFIDGTSSSKSNILLRKGILESIGYETGMVFINCSLDTALKRAAKRKREVPEEYIIQAHENIQKMKPFFKSIFHNFFKEVDNDDGELNDKMIQKAYKKTTKFFTSSLKNPIGEDIIEEMKKNKWKYLLDGIYTKSELNKVVSNWYK